MGGEPPRGSVREAGREARAAFRAATRAHLEVTDSDTQSFSASLIADRRGTEAQRREPSFTLLRARFSVRVQVQELNLRTEREHELRMSESQSRILTISMYTTRASTSRMKWPMSETLGLLGRLRADDCPIHRDESTDSTGMRRSMLGYLRRRRAAIIAAVRRHFRAPQGRTNRGVDCSNAASRCGATSISTGRSMT